MFFKYVTPVVRALWPAHLILYVLIPRILFGEHIIYENYLQLTRFLKIYILSSPLYIPTMLSVVLPHVPVRHFLSLTRTKVQIRKTAGKCRVLI